MGVESQSAGDEMSVQKDTVSLGEDMTEGAGLALARSLVGGTIVLLQGELGAGKSVFARGIARGLGVINWKGSPTFTLINEYNTRPRLYHTDLYRLTAYDVETLGLEELVTDESILVVEWPERATEYLLSLSDSPIWVTIDEVGPETRELRIDWPSRIDLRRDGDAE